MSGARFLLPERDGKFSPFDRMEKRQKMMSQLAADMGELIAAAKPLYASLSNEQKQVADRLLAGVMHGDHQEPHNDGMNRTRIGVMVGILPRA